MIPAAAITLALASLATPAQPEITLEPDPPVAGQSIVVKLSEVPSAGALILASPFGSWRQELALSPETEIRIPDDLPVLLAGVRLSSEVDVEFRLWIVNDTDGRTMRRAHFWSAYLNSGLPAPFALASPDPAYALEQAQAAARRDPEDIVVRELLWYLSGRAADDKNAFLAEANRELAAEPSGRLALAAARLHRILGDAQGAQTVESMYASRIAQTRQQEAMRWGLITSGNNTQRRLERLLEWLELDPLSDYFPMCLQILAATYSTARDWWATAAFGLASLRVLPDDAMTLNGVAFAMAEGDFELERGLMLVERAISILDHPERLSKPAQFSEERWQRELTHARAASLDTKGWLLTRLERWDGARAAFEQAIALERSDEFYLHFGLMLRDQGRLDEAVRMLNEGLKISGARRGRIEAALSELNQ